nr:MAG TPA: hypothetical protein [Caudoviricetes sp.]
MGVVCLTTIENPLLKIEEVSRVEYECTRKGRVPVANNWYMI